jgi:FKBP-type peptidyl-prolyl cis-trans isomerase
MRKKIYLFLISALMCSAALKADEVAHSETEASAKENDIPVEEEVAPAEKLATEPAEEPSVETVVEVSESELIEMVGYLTAQSGGVPMLKLDDPGVAAFAVGLLEGLTSEKKLEDISQESIEEAFGQAQARAEAIEAEAEEIPEISADASQIIGFVMAVQSGLIQLGFGPVEAPMIKKGFVEGANMTEADPAVQAKLPAFQEFMQKRVIAAQTKAAAEAEAIAAEEIAAGEMFFEELAADADVQKSESGLYYKIIEPGADEKPTLEDLALVHYKGTLIDGTQFDSSYDRGQPAEFPLNGVVAGFGEGLTKIGVGGKIILYIPSELGYGNSPRPGGPIKPGDTLIFECELIEVNP